MKKKINKKVNNIKENHVRKRMKIDKIKMKKID